MVMILFGIRPWGNIESKRQKAKSDVGTPLFTSYFSLFTSTQPPTPQLTFFHPDFNCRLWSCTRSTLTLGRVLGSRACCRITAGREFRLALKINFVRGFAVK
jgi:hypothetical protein